MMWAWWVYEELKLLKSEFEEEAKTCDVVPENQIDDYQWPMSKEEIQHFLNEPI